MKVRTVVIAQLGVIINYRRCRCHYHIRIDITAISNMVFFVMMMMIIIISSSSSSSSRSGNITVFIKESNISGPSAIGL